MKLRQLRFFITVADELGFSKAAAKLHVAQPSLSVQIKALEEEVGARLFERDKHHVFLTQAGKLFRQHAGAILAMAETAKIEARCAAAGELGTIDFGYTASSMFSRVLPPAIRGFRKQYPHVLLTLHELTSLEQFHGLLDRSLDVGVLRRPEVSTPVGIQISEWYRTPLVVAIAQDHVLAQRRSLSLAALKGEPFIMYPREAGTGIYWQVMDLCAKADFRPRVVREVLESSTIIGLVAAGAGVAVVPADMNCIRFEGVEYKRLTDAEAYSTLYLARREGDLNQHLRALIDMLGRRSGKGDGTSTASVRRKAMSR
ncbi:MAG: LysR family transcriptional regulator [Gammaproteobacteria bacterium]|jgi:DNA-binding transcriptional LysR family regulator|nr:LysR family transcriptional regulator [Gammaproteobacteria bacterium]